MGAFCATSQWTFQRFCRRMLPCSTDSKGESISSLSKRGANARLLTHLSFPLFGCAPEIVAARGSRIGFYAEVTIKWVITPKALHSKAQGRRASGAPWVNHAALDPNPNGVLQTRDAACRSFVQHEHRHARRAIVQPRWGNHAVPRIARGTRRGREPRAIECNAFGVRAIGHLGAMAKIGGLTSLRSLAAWLWPC